MKDGLRKAEEYRQTVFVTEVNKGHWTAHLNGTCLGRVTEKNLAHLESKALSFMAYNGMRNRRLVEIDHVGQRICVDVDRNKARRF